jgi:hypothetical protein
MPMHAPVYATADPPSRGRLGQETNRQSFDRLLNGLGHLVVHDLTEQTGLHRDLDKLALELGLPDLAADYRAFRGIAAPTASQVTDAKFQVPKIGVETWGMSILKITIADVREHKLIEQHCTGELGLVSPPVEPGDDTIVQTQFSVVPTYKLASMFASCEQIGVTFSVEPRSGDWVKLTSLIDADQQRVETVCWCSRTPVSWSPPPARTPPERFAPVEEESTAESTPIAPVEF